MKFDWISCELGDLITFQRGYDLPKAKMNHGRFPVVGSNGIIGWHNEYTTEAPGITIGRSGNVGKPFLIQGRSWSHNTTLYIKEFKNVDPLFIFYLLKTLDLGNYAGGSAVPTLNRNHIHTIPVAVLQRIEEQKKIARMLSVIDGKIELNEKINNNLQKQAFALFDKLMVDADNDIYKVSDYAYLNPRRILSKSQIARSIDMSQLSTSGAFPSGWDMKSYNGGMRFTNGDTLLARITPCLENGKTAFIDFLDKGEVAFDSTEYIILAPRDSVPPEMLYCLARYPAFVDYAVKNMNGSSGRQRVSAETIGQFRLPKLDEQSLSTFRDAVTPIFLKMRYNSFENTRLAELRDTLLPKLMSGEIDVSSIRL